MLTEYRIRLRAIVKSAAVIAILSAAHFALGFAVIVFVDIYNSDGRTTFADTLGWLLINILWFPFYYLAKASDGYWELAFVVASSLFWGTILFASWTAAVRSFGRRFSLSSLLTLFALLTVAIGLISAYFSAIAISP
jgi:hypothetical protein